MSDGGKGDGRRPGTIPPGAWERIFKPKPHDWPTGMGCDCEPGKCKQDRIKDCKDWMKRSEP